VDQIFKGTLFPKMRHSGLKLAMNVGYCHDCKRARCSQDIAVVKK